MFELQIILVHNLYVCQHHLTGASESVPRATGCSLNIVFFVLEFCDFSELCCSAGVVPAWCVYTHRHQGKTEKDQSSEYSKKSLEKTQYLTNTLYNHYFLQPSK